MNEKRRFLCPETGDDCVDPKCTKGNCLEKKRADEFRGQADALARKRRIERGEATAEDLGL